MDEDIVLEDEKKPFDSIGGFDDDSQPDPEETIMLESGNGRVWLVKIPRFLMDRWSAFDEEGIPLATIRIYDPPPGSSAPPRIFVQVAVDPEKPDAGTNVYEMDMTNQDVNNQIVIAEREKAPRSRARTTIMTGKVKHDCKLMPVGLDDRYRTLMKERTRIANTPQRHIQMIEGAMSGGRGIINRLSSGISTAQGFAELTRPKPKTQKGGERMARIARNVLLDELFSAYRERAHWSLKQLREKTQQPESYLKEVLNEIAVLHRSGEFNGTYELKPTFQEDGIKGEAITESSRAWTGGDAKMEDMGDEGPEGDDDGDDDMEEVISTSMS